MPEVKAGPSDRSPRGGTAAPWTVVLVSALTVIAVVAQTVQADDALTPKVIFGADGAEREAVVWAIVVAVLVLAALFLPARWRLLVPAVPAAALVGLVAVCAVNVPARAGAIVAATITLGACWEVGERTLRALGAAGLAALPPVAWLCGNGVLANLIMLIGRIGWVRWWTVGLLVFVLGTVGTARLAALAWPRRTAAITAITGSGLATACAALILVVSALTAIFAFAPELGPDAIAAKTFLPANWAHTGMIRGSVDHPNFANAGSALFVAVPGHLAGLHDVGRWLQFELGLSLSLAVWWFGRRHGALGPLGALAVVGYPHYAFQGATANDDLFLAFGALGLTLAVLTALGDSSAAGKRPVVAGIVLGVLVGTMLTLKLHLIPLSVVLVGGWALAAGRESLRGVLVRMCGVATGALAAAGGFFITRWIDYGNPVFPAYNNIFRSRFWAPVNEQLNFPFWPHAPSYGILTWPFESLRVAAPITDFGGPNILGLLIAVLTTALLLAGPAMRDQEVRLLWLAIGAAVLGWYAQFRYLRYLIPTAVVGLVVVLKIIRVQSIGRGVERCIVVVVAVFGAALFPAMVGQHLLPPKPRVPLAAALGFTEEREFLRTVRPETDIVYAFNRLSPVKAKAISQTTDRIRLDGSRDLFQDWEIDSQLRAVGGTEAQGEQLRQALNLLGVEWVIAGAGYNFNARYQVLIEQNGEFVYGDRNWAIWHLAAQPIRPRPYAPCDPMLRAGSCWRAAGLDRNPGLSAAEAGAGAVGTVPACPGSVVTVLVTVPTGSPPAAVRIEYADHDALSGSSGDQIPGGSTRLVGATAPAGARSADVTVLPGQGGVVERAVVGFQGRDC